MLRKHWAVITAFILKVLLAFGAGLGFALLL